MRCTKELLGDKYAADRENTNLKFEHEYLFLWLKTLFQNENIVHLTEWCDYEIGIKKLELGWRDDGEIGGSGIHFPLHMGETPSWSMEEQSEQPTAPQHLWR